MDIPRGFDKRINLFLVFRKGRKKNSSFGRKKLNIFEFKYISKKFYSSMFVPSSYVLVSVARYSPHTHTNI